MPIFYNFKTLSNKFQRTKKNKTFSIYGVFMDCLSNWVVGRLKAHKLMG